MPVDYGPQFEQLVRLLIDGSRYNDYALGIIGRQHGLDVNLNPEEVWEEGDRLHNLLDAVLFEDMPSAEAISQKRTTSTKQGSIVRNNLIHQDIDHPNTEGT